MTDATVLADRVVALLGGLVREDAFPFANDKVGYACIATGGMPQNADDFTSDWRVAGALLEKCRALGMMGWINIMRDIRRIPLDEPLVPAIIEACCNALEAK